MLAMLEEKLFSKH